MAAKFVSWLDPRERAVSNSAMMEWLLPLAAYLLGSISTAVLVSRVLAVPDPRTAGSRNPGATNVLRLGGRRAAIFTLLGDVGKGILPVLLARMAGLSPTGLAITAGLAFLGHLFPVFFGFRGGKGVATALGVLLALNLWLGLALILTWLTVAAAFRYSSLAALTAALLAPFYAWWLAVPRPELIAVAFMSVLLISRHRRNIANLISQQEGRIGT